MQTNTTSRIPDDEIDIKSIGSTLLSYFMYPFSLLLRNKIITLCFITFAIVLSISIKYVVPKTYTSSFVLRPTDIKDKIYLKVLADIPKLIKQKEYKTLSKELQLDTSIVSEITAIILLPSGTKNNTDSLNCTEVIIEAKNPNNFLLIQNGILSYLENNPYFIKIKNLQKKQIELGLEEINKDLIQLDSLKKLQLINYRKQSTSGINIIPLNDLYNPTASYAMAIERNEKKLGLIAQTVFLDRFQLIKPCVIFKHHSSPPRILIMCLYLVPIFLLICFVFLALKDLSAKR